MKTQVVAVHADRYPKPGITNPGPHQLYKNPVVTVEDRELGPLHPDEIRVRMLYAGICGTDVHLVQSDPLTGYVLCSAPARIPEQGRVLGHEGVGEVLECGSHVRHVKSGDIVTFESIIVCHYCDVCRRGQFNQCRKARLLGLEKDGLFGTVVDVPSMLTHDVSDLQDKKNGLIAAACVEPAGVAYVACQNTKVNGGDIVVIFGAGPIGIFCAMLAKSVFGASVVHIVEPVAFRREHARSWCDKVWDIQEFQNSAPRSIDVIIEASGRLDNVTETFRKLNANGRVALLARSGEPLSLNAVDYLITNAITIVGSRGHLCGAFAKILSLYKSDRIALDAVVTDIIKGPHGIKDLLVSPKTLFEKNCKVLAEF